MRLQKRVHPIILQLNIDSNLLLFSRFHIGEYVCPLFTVNCRVFKFPSKMQAETGQIGNRLKLTKKAKNEFESFTSHAHAKITKKQLENTYKSYCLPFKKNYTSFFAYLWWGHSTTTWSKCYPILTPHPLELAKWTFYIVSRGISPFVT